LRHCDPKYPQLFRLCPLHPLRISGGNNGCMNANSYLKYISHYYDIKIHQPAHNLYGQIFFLIWLFNKSIQPILNIFTVFLFLFKNCHLTIFLFASIFHILYVETFTFG
jgi:hypothetical protein